MPRNWPVHVFNILAAIECLRAYDEAINTHRLDFWDTNQIIGRPERPSPRAYHTMNYLREMLFIFGGVGSDGTLLGDIHFYDIGAGGWSGEIAREWCCDETGKVVGIERGYQPPAPRAHHVALTDERAGRLYVFGGYNDQFGYMDDVHYFDPEKMRWSGPLAVSGPRPTGRSGHVAFLGPQGGGDDEQAIYVFGGYSSSEGHLNDLYELSLKGDNFRWSRVSLSTTATRPGRYGGKQVSMPPIQPSGRRHAAVAVIPSSISPQSVVIVGGIHAPSSSSVDNGGNRTEESAVVFGDVWRLELVAGRIVWRELDVDSRSSQGLRRFHHTCIPSPDGTRLLIIGGREANVWSRPALLATGMPDEFGSSTYVETEKETLPPSAYTLNLETAKLTPASQGSALSPKSTCETPSGIPEPRLSWASLENDGHLQKGPSKAPTSRFGSVTAHHSGWVYEFGGYGNAEPEPAEDAEGNTILLEAGLSISYLVEGPDGIICPVWAETV